MDLANTSPDNLINIVTFNVMATQTVDGGVLPWINIGRANEEILNLIDADELVISEHEITISVDYPLSKPTAFNLFSSIGFSRKLLLVEIREQFLAFANADGENFDIAALDLVALDVYKNSSGKIEVVLDIDA
ncbi:hypothetical protein [Pedobacter sandarakinus]|uniref:hypothetical protein n=1 Tax=Pedobacter sandarakinus TaxID=353156 RepID=UPI002246CFE3|nr:hypothetical protein [Pedobacter sandarakinus]MCX2575419.1 hypothetical protein [Pedobacter sandarakinus]